MNKVSIIQGMAAPLLTSNVDTDTVIRIEPLTQCSRQELGPHAFATLRYASDGSEDPSCVLNDPRFRDAPILLAGENFGCGSSREGAVWAILASGIRCVIAESFGDIFYNNCFQNGLLPIRLSGAEIRRLAGEANAGCTLEVDLNKMTVVSGARSQCFEMEPNRREALLEGLDEVSQTMKRLPMIRNWQETDRAARPWIWDVPLRTN